MGVDEMDQEIEELSEYAQAQYELLEALVKLDIALKEAKEALEKSEDKDG